MEKIIDEKYTRYKMKLLYKYGMDLDAQYDAHKQLFVEIFSGKSYTEILGHISAGTITDYENEVRYNGCLDVILDILGGYYCFILGDCVNALRFWEYSSNMGNVNATRNIGNLYYWVHNYEEELVYYLKAVEKGCVYATRNIVMYYLTKNVDYDNVEKYIGLMSDMDDPIVSKCWGEYYNARNDYGMAIYFFERSVCFGCKTAHISIVECCIKQNNMAKALKHFDKALEYGDLRVLNYMTKFVLETHHEKLFDIFKMTFEHDHCVELFEMIRKNYNKMICWKILFMLSETCVFENKNNVVIEQLMKELENNSDVYVLKNKVKKAKDNNVFDICPICLSDNVLCVEQYCGHLICYCCYNPKMVCYYKCPDLRGPRLVPIPNTNTNTEGVMGVVTSTSTVMRLANNHINKIISKIKILIPMINPYKLGTLCLCWSWIYYNKRFMA